MPAVITEHDLRTFAAAWVNTSGNKVLSYKAVRHNCKSEQAAIRGAERMLQRPEVQGYITEAQERLKGMTAAVAGQLVVADKTTEQLVKAIAITEVQLINEYVSTAMLDYLDYYNMRTGLPKGLQELTPEQRRNIKRIEWSKPAKNGRRKVLDYILEDRAGARDQLAKITGIVNPAFDFAGLLAILTGKKKDEATEELKRLDHMEGTNFEAIRQQAGRIFEGQFKEVKA
jgi:hypothetical protein